ncbi:MAG: protoporphyrinogen oxidase [Acidimicrobiales bacterium]|nr:protoporphyrinogen oxidase [Acidimicrobiales bacterium]MDP6696747.1 protoporphyrinogen oxidase [Acidimicrobiales bacterium]
MNTGAGRRVVVVGAGITGLTTAHRLMVDRPGLETTVMESAPVAGGRLVTTPFAGLPVDEGADSFLTRVPWATDLCAELGLSDELVSPSARSASLWLDEQLRPIPTGSVLGLPLDPATVQPGLLSEADLERLAGPGVPDRPLPAGDGPAGDLSIGEVIRSCAGPGVLERLVDPLLGGVNAGMTDEMSCALMAPQFLRAARSDEGLLATLRLAVAEADPTTPVFAAHPAGMAHLVATLVGRLGERIRTSRRVLTIAADGDTWRIGLDNGTEMADAVVVATPAPVAAGLVNAACPEAATTLRGIRHASVSLAAVAYRRSDLEVPADQSGFLVPRGSDMLMTACSFAGSKWSHLDDGEHTILRVSAGRIDDDRSSHMDDDTLVSTLRRELSTTLGIEADPTAVRVTRWPDSLAQFPVGHRRQMAEMLLALSHDAPGLFVTGSAHNGVGIPACVRSGNDAAAAVSELLG